MDVVLTDIKYLAYEAKCLLPLLTSIDLRVKNHLNSLYCPSKNRSFTNQKNKYLQMTSFTLKKWHVYFAFASLLACTADTVAPAGPCEEVMTYDAGIRDIVRNKCNFSGCHDGSSGVGNYNSYQGMERILQNDAFHREVVTTKTMPKSGTLSAEEFEALKCWSENGYPEN